MHNHILIPSHSGIDTDVFSYTLVLQTVFEIAMSKLRRNWNRIQTFKFYRQTMHVHAFTSTLQNSRNTPSIHNHLLIPPTQWYCPGCVFIHSRTSENIFRIGHVETQKKPICILASRRLRYTDRPCTYMRLHSLHKNPRILHLSTITFHSTLTQWYRAGCVFIHSSAPNCAENRRY